MSVAHLDAELRAEVRNSHNSKPGAGPEASVEISIQLPAVKLGVLEATGARVELVVPELAREMDAACERIRSRHTVEQIAELEPVRAVRAMFRAWGMDPSKYRPSSEALLRRVAQGKGLYRINNVVDVINLGSMETGWPYGLYDAAQVTPPVVFRHGQPGEKYVGIGKQTWHLERRPVLADAQGPFGAPISDSTRTMITEQSESILAVIYAPVAAPSADLDRALETMAARLERHCAARVTSTRTWHRSA
jgi:DNA/RNA-binding domain of Phe-tRNA-synthetase-like protein